MRQFLLGLVVGLLLAGSLAVAAGSDVAREWPMLLMREITPEWRIGMYRGQRVTAQGPGRTLLEDVWYRCEPASPPAPAR